MKNTTRIIESIGLRLIRLTADQEVWVVQPPSWTIQHLQPLARPCRKDVPVLTKLGMWMIEKSNPLVYIQHNKNVIKVTLP